MPTLTADQRRRLNNSSPLARSLSLGQLLADSTSLRSEGRIATSHIRVGTNANDADTVTIAAGAATKDGTFFPGRTAVYEMDNNAASAAGNTRVTIGGTAALTATALAAAINATQGRYVRAATHATDTTVVDVAHLVQGGTLVVTTASGGRMLVQDNAGTLAKGEQAIYWRRRVITAEDVARTRVRVDTGFTSIDTFTARLMVSATDMTAVPYNGTITATGGVLEFTLGSAGGILVAGHILEVLIFGLI